MFKKALLTYFSVSCIYLGLAASDIGRVFPSEASEYEDPVSGALVRVLTHSPSVDVRIYQTHPQWTADGEWILFRTGDRSRDGNPQIFAVRESDGTLVQLTDGPGLSYRSLRLSRKENILYYLRDVEEGQEFIRLDLDPLFADSAKGEMRDEGYETVLDIFPRSRGMLTLNYSEGIMYYSVDHPAGEDGETVNSIVAFDIEKGTHEEILRKPFQIGHIQANPHRDGEILFCHETGGDAPQRMWIWRDGMDSAEPLFVEEELDWVTHEAWADEDHVVFNLMGHTPR